MTAFDDGNDLVYMWLADCWQLWEAASGPSQAADATCPITEAASGPSQAASGPSMAAYMGVWPCCDMPSVLLMHHV